MLVPPQLPLLPCVTSCSAPGCWYASCAGHLTVAALPARPYTPAISGADRLVPPTCHHGPCVGACASGVESYTAAPLCGSASALTSATPRRRPQPVKLQALSARWNARAVFES